MEQSLVYSILWPSFEAMRLLLRSSKNAFIMQSKSTFLEFLRGIHRCKFGPPKKFFGGEIIQGEWRNFHRARALFLTGIEFHVLPWFLVYFLVEFDLLFAFSVLSCRILDCASLFIYVHQHDRLCFPMSTEETAVFDCICWLSSSRNKTLEVCGFGPQRAMITYIFRARDFKTKNRLSRTPKVP